MAAIRQRNILAGFSAAALAGVLFSSSALAEVGSNFPYDAPPDGKVGECFARVLIPAQYRTYSEQVVIDEGGSRISVSAPQFASAQQQYVRRDAGVRYEVRQPVYKIVSEQVMVRPGYKTLRVIPAKYRNVTEQVQISAPRLTWKPGASLASMAGVKRTETRQGEVYCLVEEPAETQTISKRIQVRAESVQEVNVPPVYRTITREVLVDPGGVNKIPVPAQYGSYDVQQLVQPARQVSHPIAPRMGNITRKEQISGESFAWIKVLCETNATPAVISEVQGLLQKQGLYQGPIDGQIGRSTEAAIASYQQQMNIPHGGFLSLQTIEHLRDGSRPLPVTANGPHVSSPNWMQSAPAQYSYQSSNDNWSSSGGYDPVNEGGVHRGNWDNSNHGLTQTHFANRDYSRIPDGEFPSNIQLEYSSTQVATTRGVQQWHSGQLLSWSGK